MFKVNLFTQVGRWVDMSSGWARKGEMMKEKEKNEEGKEVKEEKE